MNYDDILRRGKEHAVNPEAGDYWTDHFSPVYAVVDVGPFHVSFLYETEATDVDHWTWDVTKVRTVTRREFNDLVRYRGISKGGSDEVWCECWPGRMKDFIPHALASATSKDIQEGGG